MRTNARHVLILGAGFSKGVCGFPTIGDFFAAKSGAIWERFPFLRMTLDFFYGTGPLQQATPSAHERSFKESLEERRISLEDAWDKILYMIYNPEPVLMYRDLKLEFERCWDNELLREREYAGRGMRFFSWFKDFDPKARRDFTYLLIFADWELKKLVLETYHCADLSERQVDRVFEATQIGDWLRESPDAVVDIISFNYDIVMEMCLARRGLAFSYEMDCFEKRGNCRIRIIKPHGSLSWQRRLIVDSRGYFARDTVEQNIPGRILDAADIGFARRAYKGSPCFEYTEPAMLPVVYEKSDYYYHFIPERPDNPDSDTLRLFKIKKPDAVEDALTNGDHVRIIGYRFSNADRVVTRLFPSVRAEREKTRRPLKGLYWKLLNEKGEDRFEERLTARAQSLFYVDENAITVDPRPLSCEIPAGCSGR